MSQQYELLNYSGYGTFVNNVLYSNDERDKSAKKAEKQSVEDQVRDVVDKKRNVTRSKDSHCKMAAVECLDRIECSCNQSSYEDLTTGWEGSAVLSHGSLLRFGCTCFVFSIVDGAADI